MHKRNFVDTKEKAKDREDHRRKVQETLEKEVKQLKLEESIRQKNRQIGQLSLFDAGKITTLSQFMKKPKRR